MYVRISFEQQKVTKAVLDEIRKVLADDIASVNLYKKQDGSISTIWSYKETIDPNDPELTSLDDKGQPKKVLVYETEFVQLDYTKEYFGDLDLFLSKFPDLKVKIRGLPQTVEKNYYTVVDEIVRIQDKFENALKKFDSQIEFNQKCDVHIGNLGLLNINRIGFLEDGCSDKLQSYLSQGWRLLAVCPQPDKRRPDYVLGKYDPDYISTKAERL